MTIQNRPPDIPSPSVPRRLRPSMIEGNEGFFLDGGSRSGPAVLLIHGLSGSPGEMRFVGRELAEAGFAVHAPRLTGHGGDGLDRTGWRDWFADVEAAHAALAARHRPVFVAGLCLGAHLALHLAHRHPDGVAGLALYSPTLWYDGWAIPRVAALLPLLLATPFAGKIRFVATDPHGIKDERVRRRILAARTGPATITGTTLRELQALNRRLRSELANIATPTLILHSLEDDIASPRTPRYLADHLGGPVRTLLLKDCHHMITIDRQRAMVARETVSFFSGLPDRPPPPA